MIDTDIENLKYPLGKPVFPQNISQSHIDKWIATIEKFPFEVFQITSELKEQQLSWAYRQEGWSIRQLVHHCADSHLSSFIRFKWTLTEESPTIKAYFEDRWAQLPDSKMAPITPSQTLLNGLHERWTFLMKKMTSEDWQKSFTHPETGKEINLKRNLAIYDWHCRHHLAHIQLALELEGKYVQK